MSLHDPSYIQSRLKTVSDPTGFLTHLFARSPVGFAVWSADGKPLLTNQAFMDLFLVEPPPEYNVLEDELLAANGMLALFKRAFAGEAVQVPTFWYDPREHTRITVKEGRRVAISMSIFPLFKEGGTVEYVAATYKDETELMLSTELLKSNRDRLELAQHAGRLGTFEWNVQTGVNTWTAELEALYGLKAGEFGKTQQSWEQLVHPEDRSGAVALVDRALHTFVPVEGEWRVLWPDKSVHWLFGRFQAFKDERGATQSLMGVNLDISERKQSELATARATERLRVLAESSRLFAATTIDSASLLKNVAQTIATLVGDGCTIALLDNDDGEHLVNVANAHRDAALDKDCNARLMGMRIPISTSETLAAKVMRTGEPQLVADIEPTVLVKQAELSPLSAIVERLNIHSVVVVPLRQRQRLIGTLSSFRSGPGRAYTEDDLNLFLDLSERAGLALENARHYEELEQRVAQRTAALEETNRELEAFSYSISHDLGAPLRAIRGFSTALLESGERGLDTTEARHLLDRIIASANRMSELMEALLRLGRLKRSTVRITSVDLTKLATSILEHLRSTEPHRNVECVVMENMVAQGDLSLLQAALENLLGNAWKFTRHQPHAKIEVGRETLAGATVYYVRDNGAGFDMTHKHKLFTPFRRLHTAEQFEGTGVGLATVQRIIQRHGGQIWAEGAVNQGATFRFTLS